MQRCIAFVAAVSITLAPLVAADQPWPQFRGLNGSGIATNQKPPVEFGPDKNLKWKVAVPSGLSSPIVAKNMIVVTAFDEGRLYTIAYHRADGSEAWRAAAPAKEIGKYHKTEGSPAASTAVTDGERIVSYFGSCGLVCYDLSGNELWKFELPTAAVAGDFGSGVSPILVEGKVILVRDQMKDSSIYAVNAATGAKVWETKRLSPASYSTPVVWDTPAGKQIVVAGHSRIIGYNLKTGHEKWFVAESPSACCSSPVTADGLLLFAGSSGGGDEGEIQHPSFDDILKMLDKNKDGALDREEAEKAFEGFFDNQDLNKDGKITRDEWDLLAKFFAEGHNSAIAVSPDASGELTESKLRWKHTKNLPYIASAIAYQGQYLMVRDGGIVTALDAKSGDQIYTGRVAASGKYYASPVAANGNVYFTSLDGAVTVLKAGTDKPVVVVKNAKLDERTSATPAIADNTLYLRTEKHLYAFAETK